MNNPQTLISQKDKGGRPKMPANLLRDRMVKVYFDRENYAKLKRKQKRTGLSLSSLVYQLAVNGYIKEPIPKEVAADIRKLSGMANNLNQLAHEAHRYSFHLVEKEVLEIAEKINKLIIGISQK